MITASAGPLASSVNRVTITAAIVAPICGTRSSSPTISASTIGEGAPMIAAVTPTTVPAMTEITMLPISVNEMALQTSPSIRSNRPPCSGRMSSTAARVSCGLASSPNSVKNVSVTSEKTLPTTPAAAPSRLTAAEGRFFAASAATLSSFLNASVSLSMSSSTPLCCALSM